MDPGLRRDDGNGGVLNCWQWGRAQLLAMGACSIAGNGGVLNCWQWGLRQLAAVEGSSIGDGGGFIE
jgi:hypothetical protein